MLTEELYPRMKERPVFADRNSRMQFWRVSCYEFRPRHPDLVAAIFSLAAKFDIRDQMDGVYNDDVYFNNPVDYLPDLEDPWLWKSQIFLGSAEYDMCLDASYNLAHVLGTKQVPHMLQVKPNDKHDWPCWKSSSLLFKSAGH